MIYKIVNDINDKVYIGLTTNNLKERIREYKNEYRFCKKERPIIKAMREIGIEHFHWEIVEDNIISEQELNKKEILYIKQFKSLTTQNGYNADLGGNGIGKHSKETKKKISEAQQKEKNHMYNIKGYDNACSKEVIELTTGQRYGSASVAGEILNANFSHICAVCRGERGSTGGYVFRYIVNNEIQQPQKIT